MTIATAILLALAVLGSWLAVAIFVRLRGPLERIHMVTAINVAGGGPMAIAAFATDGVSSRSLKCALIFVALVIGGALLSHVSGRALHLRAGERR